MKIFRARHIAPMVGPMIADGAVAVEGELVAGVGRFEAVRREFGGEVEDLGECVVLPGLVNAHIHLELSGMHSAAILPGTGPRDFVKWLLEIIRQAPPPEMDAVQRDVEKGIKESLGFGVTCVGDITRNPAVSRGILGRSKMRGRSFGEVTAMGPRRGFLAERLRAAVEEGGSGIRVGVSPHAPYSVEAAGYRACLTEAKERKLGLATHLAESADEAAFLRNHSGVFAALWQAIGGLDEAVPTFDGGPIRFAEAVGLLDFPSILAHVNYCDDEEMEILAAGSASVVFCPRTHAYFGHPPHRWREMMKKGILVAVGTDSLGSSPDLNLVEELRLMRRVGAEASALFEMATVAGARALGMDDMLGGLAPGKVADFCLFESRTDAPLDAILDRGLPARGAFVGGRRVTAQQ